MINYTDEEILPILKNEQKTEEFISGLTGEDVKRLLLYVNSRVRNIPIEENKFCEETMCAGGLVSPNNEIQSAYFEKIAEALKNVKEKKDRATMMFYLINELHLFEDGNGRTSRAVFEMFSKNDFSFENNDLITHINSSIGIEHAKVSHDEFQKSNNIEGSCHAEQCANCFLYKSLIKFGIIPDTDFYKKKFLINTDADELLESNIYGEGKDNNPVFVSEDVKKQLSYKQFKQIQNALADNNGSLITTSGMALLLMAMKNEKIGDLSNYEFAEGQRLGFLVDRESGSGEEHLSNLEKEDYLKIIDIANILKEGMLDMILDFFEHSNDFRFDKNNTMKDILINGKIRQTTIDILNLPENHGLFNDYEISRAISQNGIVDISGTRTEKTMQVLVQYLEQNISRNNNSVEVNDIGKQVIGEISDPTLEDETEKQQQTDLENMQNRETQEK